MAAAHRPRDFHKERDPFPDRDPGPEDEAIHGPAPVVLVDEDPHGAVEGADLVDVAPADALPLVVDDPGLADVVDLPPRLLDLEAPVEVFPVHEILLVEAADLLVDLAPQRHERPADRVHLVGAAGVEVPEVVAAEDAGTGVEGAEAGDFREGDPRRGKTPPAGRLEGAVRVEDGAAGEARVGMLVEETDDDLERVFLDDSAGG